MCDSRVSLRSSKTFSTYIKGLQLRMCLLLVLLPLLVPLPPPVASACRVCGKRSRVAESSMFFNSLLFKLAWWRWWWRWWWRRPISRPPSSIERAERTRATCSRSPIDNLTVFLHRGSFVWHLFLISLIVFLILFLDCFFESLLGFLPMTFRA